MQQRRANPPKRLDTRPLLGQYRPHALHPAITHRGRLVAIVAGGQAIISDTVPSHEQATVKAMCVYALEIADGERPGPYTDAHALA